MKLYLSGAQKIMSKDIMKKHKEHGKITYELESYFYIKTSIDSVKDKVEKYEGEENENK
jgi:hypothetical protein